MQQVFECPYAKKPLPRPCEVSSCSFNLPCSSSLSKYYKRCFLNYIENGVTNPHHLSTIEQAQFSQLTLKQKRALLRGLFKTKDSDIDHAHRTFYLSFFTILLQDILLEVPRGNLSPVPFSQCSVCGAMDDEESPRFFYPKGGSLPRGYGYCSWNCYQLKPPPILLLEYVLDADFRDLVEHPDLSTCLKKSSVPTMIYWLYSGVSLS